VELDIEQVPAAGVCRDCGSTIPLPDFPLMCSACGGLDVDVTEGEELEVESLELELDQLEPDQALLTGTEA
jgi:hydrogenase nickel incorporation protein HypA/HybF